jgi:hypothetical protein
MLATTCRAITKAFHFLAMPTSTPSALWVGSWLAGLEDVLRLLRPLAFVMLSSVAMLFATTDASAGTPCVVQIAPPPEAYGTDASAVRTAVAAEIKELDAAIAGRAQRRVIVSVSVAAPVSNPIICNVNAVVLDARTGAIIAIVESQARASGPLNVDQRKQLAYRAVRTAVRRVPNALTAK